MANLIKKIKNIFKKEDGAIAIITIIFLSSVGLVAIIALWSIGIATGAYNKLYIANQTAAFSAVTTAKPKSGLSQPGFNCLDDPTSPGSGDKFVCKGGETFRVAEKVFERSINSGNTFGMNYPYNVVFFSTGGNYEGPRQNNALSVFEIPFPSGYVNFVSGLIEANPTLDESLAGCKGQGQPSQIAFQANEQLYCWRIVENGFAFKPQYNSGILTQAEATIPTIPITDGCDSNPTFFGLTNCLTIKVQAAASVGQTEKSDYDYVVD